MRLPPSVMNRSPAGVRRGRTSRGEHFQGRSGDFQPESDDLDRHRRVRAQPIDQLGAIDDDGETAAGVGDDLLAQQGAAQSLDQVQGAAFDLVGAVDREVDLSMLGEGGQRNAGRPRLRRRSLRRRNADEAQALPMPAGQGLDRECRRRAGAEPDDHAVLDQLDRRLRRLALEGIAIGVVRWPGGPCGGAGADRGDGCPVVLRAEDRRAGDDRGGARRGSLSRRHLVLAAIDLDHRVEAALRCTSSRMRRILGSISGRKDCPPNPGLTVITRMMSQRCRTYSMSSGGLAGSITTPGLLAERADLAERAMQVDRGAGLGLDQQVIGAGFGEGRDIALGLDDHQMDVERLCRRAANRLEHDRADRDVGNEAAVHHVDMDPIGAGGVDGAHLLAQTREVGRQDRGRDEDRGRHRSPGQEQKPLSRGPRPPPPLPRRGAVDEPDEVADGLDTRCRHVAAAGADRLEDRGLLLARHQEGHLPAALDHRIGQW